MAEASAAMSSLSWMFAKNVGNEKCIVVAPLACGCSAVEGKGTCDLCHDEPFPWFFLSFTMNNKIPIFIMY